MPDSRGSLLNVLADLGLSKEGLYSTVDKDTCRMQGDYKGVLVGFSSPDLAEQNLLFEAEPLHPQP